VSDVLADQIARSLDALEAGDANLALLRLINAVARLAHEVRKTGVQ
jgi:hypothetical protein